jgi:quinol monooxygenase YgiN
MVHVVATIEAAEGKRDAVLAEFRRIIPAVRAEDGCIEYGTAVDVASGHPAQLPLRPDVVTVVEKWASLDALRAHGQAPHMLDFRQRTSGLVKKVTLQVMDPVD